MPTRPGPRYKGIEKKAALWEIRPIQMNWWAADKTGLYRARAMAELNDRAAYALVSPTGKLMFCEDSPQQMIKNVSFGATRPREFTIVCPSTGGPGLHGCITSIDHPVAPPNNLAPTMIAALGGPAYDQWLGILGICGSKLGNPTGIVELCGLIAAQQRLIQAIYFATRTRHRAERW